MILPSGWLSRRHSHRFDELKGWNAELWNFSRSPCGLLDIRLHAPDSLSEPFILVCVNCRHIELAQHWIVDDLTVTPYDDGTVFGGLVLEGPESRLSDPLLCGPIVRGTFLCDLDGAGRADGRADSRGGERITRRPRPQRPGPIGSDRRHSRLRQRTDPVCCRRGLYPRPVRPGPIGSDRRHSRLRKGVRSPAVSRANVRRSRSLMAAGESERPLPFPEVQEGVARTQHEGRRRRVHGPTALDSRELAGAFRIVGHELGDE